MDNTSQMMIEAGDTIAALKVLVRDGEERIKVLRELVKRASEDSCVTTDEREPGCFYCDHVEHTAGCPAAAALGASDG